MNKIRAGNVLIRISGIFYEVPDVPLIKTPNGKDCYLSGTRLEENNNKKSYICTVKLIEDNKYITVNYNEISSVLDKEGYKKSLFYDNEYDIPESIYNEVNSKYKSINKFDIKNKKLFIESVEKYLFNK